MRSPVVRRDFAVSHLVLAAFLAIPVLSVTPARCQIQVTTYHNDNARTGLQPRETVLTPAAVASGRFRRLFSCSVDGQVYAQPLYLSDITLPGRGRHNVVFVATEHNSVYAFDADSNSGENATPLWQVSFNDPARGITPVPVEDTSCSRGNGYSVEPELGITATPVIDSVTNTLYVAAQTKSMEQAFPTYHHHLHALDVTTGAEKFGGPVEITATARGVGEGSRDSIIAFDPIQYKERCGLALHNGVLYTTWASHCDNDPYHGWVMAYDAYSLTQITAWCSSPDGRQAAFWNSGAAPAIDEDGSLYLISGNGTFDADLGGRNYGDSFLRLRLRGSELTVADYFTPYNQEELNTYDLDLGSGGVMLLTGQSGATPNLVLGGGKTGTLYLLDRTDLGGYNQDGDLVHQILPEAVGNIFSAPAYFNGSVYYGGLSTPIQGFRLTEGRLQATPFTESADRFGYPGVTPSISSNGNRDGVLWGIARGSNGNARLVAYDALDLKKLLYDSDQTDGRDLFGKYNRFNVSTIANGHLYAASADRLAVFGLAPLE